MNRKMGKLGYMISLPVLAIIYGWLNRDNGKVFSVMTDLDRLIPFSKYFIVPYLLWIPFLAGMLTFFFFQDSRLYKKQLLTINIGALICFLIYIFFQTTVPRPELTGTDFLTNLVRITYSWDNPYNALPSTHVLTSYSIFLGIQELSPGSKLTMKLAGFMCLAIIVSTVFLKQHTILDCTASIVIVNVLSNVLEAAKGEELALWTKKLSLLWMAKLKETSYLSGK